MAFKSKRVHLIVMDRSTTGSSDTGGEPPSRRRRKLTDTEQSIKAAVMDYLLENTDAGPDRNTLSLLFKKFKDMTARSTLHKYLKQLVDQRWLVEEKDTIISVNNQPMAVVRYSVNPSRLDMARTMASDRRARRL
jgi:hypothetical protein